MSWTIKISDSAVKDLKSLDSKTLNRIARFIDRLKDHPDPLKLAKPLKGPWAPLWRFRMGNYRLICDIDAESKTILILRIGHRKEIYK